MEAAGSPAPQGFAGRKRPTAEDEALSLMARQAEARLAAKRAARAEAREIRMKELERQQKEEDTECYSRKSRRHTSVSDEDERMSLGSHGSLRVEERPDKDFERGVRAASSLSAATLASLGGTSSRRGSGDTSMSVDTDASIREIKDISELKCQIQDVEGKYTQELKKMKDSLAEVEEKYKKAMVSNAQLDNEKTNFMYQVDALKDALLELEEQLAETRRQYEERNKDFEREKHAHGILQFQFMEVKEVLKQREELLETHGIIYNSEVATNGEIPSDRLSGSSTIVPVTGRAVKVAEDRTPDRAIEMEMKNENMEEVRKREILQNTEREEHTEETKEVEFVQECLDTKKLHADGDVEKEEITEGQVVSVNNHSVHVPSIVSSLKNSDVAELKDERGLLGNTAELKEDNAKDIEYGDVINEINSKNATVGPCIEANQEAVITSAVLAQQDNKEKQTDVLADEAGASNNDVLEETLDSAINNPTAASSQSEPLKPGEDALTQPPEPSNAERSRDDGESAGDKVVESDLEKQVANGRFELSNKAERDEKDTDKTKERNMAENSVLQQETKVAASTAEKEEPLHTSESAQAELVEEEKQVKVQETQSASLNRDLLVEVKQKGKEEREDENPARKSDAKKAKQSQSSSEDLNASAGKNKKKKNKKKKNNAQRPVEKVRSEETVVESALQSECREMPVLLENNSGENGEVKSEIVPDGKTLAHVSTGGGEAAEENHGEDHPAQVQHEPTEEQSAEEQAEIIQEPPATEYIEKAAEGREEEDKDPGKEEERQDTLLDVQDSACLEPPKARSSAQAEKRDSEDEEATEEYHEAVDFRAFPSEEPNIAERDVSHSSEEEENHETRKKGENAEGTTQNVLQEDGDGECQCKEDRVAGEDDKQSSAKPGINESILSKGEQNIQGEEEVKESEKAKPAGIESSLPASAESPCEGKPLEKSGTKEIAGRPAEKLDRPGRREAVDESPEEIQGNRKGKGKHSEECVIS